VKRDSTKNNRKLLGLKAEISQNRSENSNLTLSNYFDQGMKPTHKLVLSEAEVAEIVQLYEEGLDEAEIAHRSQHAQSSVGRYLRDYERVKLSLQRRIPVEQIPSFTNMQPGVVCAYVNLVSKYQPDLLSNLESAPIGA